MQKKTDGSSRAREPIPLRASERQPVNSDLLVNFLEKFQGTCLLLRLRDEVLRRNRPRDTCDGSQQHPCCPRLPGGCTQRSREYAGLSDSDQAEIYGIKGTLAARARDFATAVSDYQQSIDFWIRARGPKDYLAARGYAMQADAYLAIGD